MLGRVVEREDGRLAVRTSVPRTLLVALASALAVAMGIYLCAGSLRPSVFANPFFSPSARVLVFGVGTATVLFFGFTLAFFLGRLLSFRRPIFEMGPRGIVDRSSALGAGFVPWEQVEGVGVRRFLGRRLLVVRVRDAQALLARQSLLKRWVMDINQRIMGAPVNVPLGALAVRDDELLQDIERHLS